ncbi:MAG: phage holin [Oceanobacillus sp.]|nr:phage holin [Oceanobacillus sp.]
MNNKVYDVLKWIALVVLPAMAALYLTLAQIWGLPYGEAIAATITAIDAFLGAILGISSIQYSKKVKNNAK